MGSKRTLVIAASTVLLLALGAGAGLSSTASPRQALPLSAIAGTYYRGAGLGFSYSLEISPAGTFHARWTGCLGTYGETTGKVIRKGSEIDLEDDAHGRRTVSRYQPVRWGDRMYLVAVEDLQGFAGEVEQGREPRRGPHGSHYLRKGDWRVAVSGRPDLAAPR
jgi:hypothetical protein